MEQVGCTPRCRAGAAGPEDRQHRWATKVTASITVSRGSVEPVGAAGGVAHHREGGIQVGERRPHPLGHHRGAPRSGPWTPRRACSRARRSRAASPAASRPGRRVGRGRGAGASAVAAGPKSASMQAGKKMAAASRGWAVPGRRSRRRAGRRRPAAPSRAPGARRAAPPAREEPVGERSRRRGARRAAGDRAVPVPGRRGAAALGGRRGLVAPQPLHHRAGVDVTGQAVRHSESAAQVSTAS